MKRILIGVALLGSLWASSAWPATVTISDLTGRMMMYDIQVDGDLGGKLDMNALAPLMLKNFEDDAEYHDLLRDLRSGSRLIDLDDDD